MTASWRIACSCGGKGADAFSKPQGAALYCEACGRTLVPERHPIAFDRAKYQLFLVTGDYRNTDHVKAVAATSGSSLVTARRLLEQRTKPVFVGKAIQVLAEKVALEMKGLTLRIEPAFAWA